MSRTGPIPLSPAFSESLALSRPLGCPSPTGVRVPLAEGVGYSSNSEWIESTRFSSERSKDGDGDGGGKGGKRCAREEEKRTFGVFTKAVGMPPGIGTGKQYSSRDEARGRELRGEKRRPPLLLENVYYRFEKRGTLVSRLVSRERTSRGRLGVKF